MKSVRIMDKLTYKICSVLAYSNTSENLRQYIDMSTRKRKLERLTDFVEFGVKYEIR